MGDIVIPEEATPFLLAIFKAHEQQAQHADDMIAGMLEEAWASQAAIRAGVSKAMSQLPQWPTTEQYELALQQISWAMYPDNEMIDLHRRPLG